MDDLEQRIASVEAQVSRLADRMADMQEAVRDVARGVKTLIELRVQGEHHDEEIRKLREQGHRHANMLEHLVMLERRFDQLTDDVAALRVASARNSVIVSLVSGGIAAAIALVVRGLLT